MDGALSATSPSAYLVALDLTSEAVLICDRAGHVLHTNAACAQLSGYPRNALLGRPLSLLFDDHLLAHAARRALREPCTLDVDSVDAGGRPLALTVTVAPARDVRGRLQHFVITARPRAQPAAPASGVLSVVARLVSEAAHDLNNQISVVLNYTFVLLRRIPGDSELRAHVQETQSAAWRASQLAQGLSHLGGERLLDATELDGNAMLADLAPVLERALDGATVVLRAPEHMVRLRVRAAQLHWLLVELALHQRSALGALQSLVIEARQEGGSTVVELTATARSRPETTPQNNEVLAPLVPGDPSLAAAVELARKHMHAVLSTGAPDEHRLRYRLVFGSP